MDTEEVHGWSLDYKLKFTAHNLGLVRLAGKMTDVDIDADANLL